MATLDATTQRVQRILVGEFNDVRLKKDGGFYLEYGSSVVYVVPREWAPDSDGNPRSLVQVYAPIGRDVTSTPELYRWAATEGQTSFFGSVTVLEADAGKCALMFDQTLLGDYLDPAELTTAVYAVIFTADELDDVVHTKFGGKRYTDPD